MSVPAVASLCSLLLFEALQLVPQPLLCQTRILGTHLLLNGSLPNFSTDAGQFAMIESVTPKDKKVVFEFVAAVPVDKDLSQYDNGIGPLSFESLRLISFPGGQQYGAISPCEMNEFSDECEAWENENGPYKKQDYMMKSNPRTAGR